MRSRRGQRVRAWCSRRVAALAPDRPVTAEEGYRMWAPTYASPPNLFQQLEHEALTALLPRLAGCVALDLGCGTGRTTMTLLDRGAARVVGVDRSRPMLLRAVSCAPRAASVIQADAGRLPVADSSVDVVVSGLMFGHVADLRGAIDEVARVLRPSGTLLVSDFHPDATRAGWHRTFMDPTSGREHRFEQHLHTLNDYAAAFERHGIVIEAIQEARHEQTPVVFVLRARTRGDTAP